MFNESITRGIDESPQPSQRYAGRYVSRNNA